MSYSTPGIHQNDGCLLDFVQRLEQSGKGLFNNLNT